MSSPWQPTCICKRWPPHPHARFPQKPPCLILYLPVLSAPTNQARSLSLDLRLLSLLLLALLWLGLSAWAKARYTQGSLDCGLIFCAWATPPPPSPRPSPYLIGIGLMYTVLGLGLTLLSAIAFFHTLDER